VKKGIILEMDKRYVTLLTPDGQFLRAHNQANAYQIGQEITFLPIEESAEKGTSPTHFYQKMKGKMALVAMVMLVVIASLLIPIYQRNQVYAYMSIDQANVELAINKQLEVIEVTPYNQKGEVILQSIDNWENEDLSSVSKIILNVMDEQGLSDQNEIVLSMVYKGKRNNQTDTNLQTELAELKQFVTRNDKKILQLQGSTVERKKALEKGISIGKLKREAKQIREKNPRTELKQKDLKKPPVEQPKKNQQVVPSESTNQDQPKAPNKQEYKDERKASQSEEQPNQQKEQKQEILKIKKEKIKPETQVSNQNNGIENKPKFKEKNK
jgi:hypothetical protein